MSCVFCDDPARAGDVVYETPYALVILHEDWSVRGHAMIVARQHVENPSDLVPAEWAHITNVWHFAERALLALTGADRVMAMKLGIQTPHLHVHLYPFASTSTREDVFAAIEGRVGVPRDEVFVETLRRALERRRPGG